MSQVPKPELTEATQNTPIVAKVVTVATVTTLATIGVFWVASVNSGLGTWDMAFILIPISWVEMLIAAKIAERLFARYH